MFSRHDSDTAICLNYWGTVNEDNIPSDNEISHYNLIGDGDFRSWECIEILKMADIVVTNPPFSLFREYVAQLIAYNKKFLIIGHQNAISYKEIFPLIKDGKIWLGYGFKGGAGHFIAPSYEDYAVATDRKEGMIRVSGVVWFTNLDHHKRHEEIRLYKSYTPEDFPTYDNYDAINVDRVADIPVNYDGVMGVPITFLDKYNPDQFEILGLSQKVGFGLKSYKRYDDFRETRQDGTQTRSSGRKTNGNAVLRGKSKKGNFYVRGDEVVHSLYGQIFIRKKGV